MRRLLAFACPLVSLFVLAGCWDVEEINRRAVVVAWGMDAEPRGRVTVSAQLPVLEGISTIPGAQGSVAKPFYVISATADTPFAAIPELQSKTSRGLFVGQMKVVIIGAELAERGAKGIVDFMNRHPEIPPQSVVVLTNGRARDMLDATVATRALTGIAIWGHLTSPSKGDRAFGLRTWQFVRAVEQDHNSAYLPILAYDSEEKTFSIKGMGVFRGDRLVGELSAEEARMFGLLTGRTNSGYVAVRLGDGRRVAFRDIRAKSAVKIQNGKRLGFVVDVRCNGFMVEATSGETEIENGRIVSIQRAVERYLTKEMRRLVRRLQEMGSDIMGFGEIVRARQPGIWRQIDWKDAYPSVPIGIRVKLNIERMGSYR